MNRVQELHQSLDRLTLKSFDLMEKLLEERKQLELFMRQGFFQMTQARSTMGVQSVSALQLPLEDGREAQALFKVDHDSSTPENSLDETAHIHFLESQEKDSAAPTEMFDSDGLRKRAANIKIENLTDDLKKTKLSSRTFDSPYDPLKWFGVLVPQSLRSCQRTFYDSLLAACRIATLQSNLETVKSQYLDQSMELEKLEKIVEKN